MSVVSEVMIMITKIHMGSYISAKHY